MTAPPRRSPQPCERNCPGWAVFNEGTSPVIERCDACWVAVDDADAATDEDYVTHPACVAELERVKRSLVPPPSDAQRIRAALQVVGRYGGIDGAHHKQWVLDQVVRALTPDYDKWLAEQRAGEDGPETYSWDPGIPP